MTSRQILDRAVERALNADIRLVGLWEPLTFLKGNEAVVALHVAALAGGRIDETQLVKTLTRSRSIEEILQALDAENLRPAVDFQTGNLFA